MRRSNIDVCHVDTLSAGNIGDNGLEATSGIQLDSATGFDYRCNTPPAGEAVRVQSVRVGCG